MSVSVKSVSYSDNPVYSFGKPHIFLKELIVSVPVVKANVYMNLRFTIKSGFKCDGASVPFAFRWFLPSWDDENFVYNLGAAIHDGLYIHKGFGLFSREECDDILRGIWRESGISRFKAGVADKCIEWFAGGKNHFGNDNFGVADLFLMEF